MRETSGVHVRPESPFNFTRIRNESILSTDQQIEKLKEYKATLINSAVTGKIKVPEVDSGC
ncbi:restriction endonuclease subunit S [Neptunomonas sp.]|uniref:restriction endonuclease subunit S n=1 Tax=Neptunomonas sp. TaxID=1971898 RepID=UPI00356A7F19